jgi:hypothetical protein
MNSKFHEHVFDELENIFDKKIKTNSEYIKLRNAVNILSIDFKEKLSQEQKTAANELEKSFFEMAALKEEIIYIELLDKQI